MAWFRKERRRLSPQKKREMPEGVWVKCDQCGEIIYRKELARNFWVCSNCQYHFRISCLNYLEILLDEETFEEYDFHLQSTDPLHFRDSKRYIDRLREAVERTGRNEAVVSGMGSVEGIRVSIGVMDFSFIGGSMGTVVGEKIARTIRRGLDERVPVVTVAASGGARMMEGILSLMQMSKTATLLGELAEVGVPHVSILTDPTTGGVTASYAMLGDIILAEPGALIGFAGPRVIEQTIRQDLPEGFQRAEFLLEHGMIDQVVPRGELKSQLAKILSFYLPL